MKLQTRILWHFVLSALWVHNANAIWSDSVFLRSGLSILHSMGPIFSQVNFLTTFVKSIARQIPNISSIYLKLSVWEPLALHSQFRTSDQEGGTSLNFNEEINFIWGLIILIYISISWLCQTILYFFNWHDLLIYPH